MLRQDLQVKVEEGLNRRKMLRKKAMKTEVSQDFWETVDGKLAQEDRVMTLFELVEFYALRLQRPGLYFKNGRLNQSALCRYARVDDSSMSELKADDPTPNKETLLKLVFALHLSVTQAEEFMNRGSSSLDTGAPRDCVVLALLDRRIYDAEDVYEVLEEYGTKVWKFKNIYESPEDEKD